MADTKEDDRPKTASDDDHFARLGAEADKLFDDLRKREKFAPAKSDEVPSLSGTQQRGPGSGFGARIPDADLFEGKDWAKFTPDYAGADRYQKIVEASEKEHPGDHTQTQRYKDLAKFIGGPNGEIPQWMQEQGPLKAAIREYCLADNDKDRQAAMRLLEKEVLTGSTAYAAEALKGLSFFDAAKRLEDSQKALEEARKSSDGPAAIRALREQQKALRDIAGLEGNYDKANQYLENFPSGDAGGRAFQQKQVEMARAAARREKDQMSVSSDQSYDKLLQAKTPEERQKAIQDFSKQAEKQIGRTGEAGALGQFLREAKLADAYKGISENLNDPEKLAGALKDLRKLNFESSEFFAKIGWNDQKNRFGDHQKVIDENISKLLNKDTQSQALKDFQDAFNRAGKQFAEKASQQLKDTETFRLWNSNKYSQMGTSLEDLSKNLKSEKPDAAQAGKSLSQILELAKNGFGPAQKLFESMKWFDKEKEYDWKQIGPDIEKRIARLADPAQKEQALKELVGDLKGNATVQSAEKVKAEAAKNPDWKAPNPSDFLDRFPDREAVEKARKEVEAFAEQNFKQADDAFAKFLGREGSKEEREKNRADQIKQVEQSNDERLSALKRDHFGKTLDWMKSVDTLTKLKEADDPAKAAALLETLYDSAQKGNIHAGNYMAPLLKSQEDLKLGKDEGKYGPIQSLLTQLRSDDANERQTALERVKSLVPDPQSDMDDFRIKRVVRHTQEDTNSSDWKKVVDGLEAEAKAGNSKAGDYLDWAKAQQLTRELTDLSAGYVKRDSRAIRTGIPDPEKAGAIIEKLGEMAKSGNKYARANLLAIGMATADSNSVLTWYSKGHGEVDGKPIFMPKLEKIQNDHGDLIRVVAADQFAQVVNKTGKALDRSEAAGIAVILGDTASKIEQVKAQKGEKSLEFQNTRDTKAILEQLMLKSIRGGGKNAENAMEGLADSILLKVTGSEHLADLFIAGARTSTFRGNLFHFSFDAKEGKPEALKIMAAAAAGLAGDHYSRDFAQGILTGEASDRNRDKTIAALLDIQKQYGDQDSLSLTLGLVAAKNPGLSDKASDAIIAESKKAKSKEELQSSLTALAIDPKLSDKTIKAAVDAYGKADMNDKRLLEIVRATASELPEGVRFTLRDGFSKIPDDLKGKLGDAFQTQNNPQELRKTLEEMAKTDPRIKEGLILSVVQLKQDNELRASLLKEMSGMTPKQADVFLHNKQYSDPRVSAGMATALRSARKDGASEKSILQDVLSARDERRRSAAVSGMFADAKHLENYDIQLLSEKVTPQITEGLRAASAELPQALHREFAEKLRAKLGAVDISSPAARQESIKEQVEMVKCMGLLGRHANSDDVRRLAELHDPEKALGTKLSPEEKEQISREAGLSLCRIIATSSDTSARDAAVKEFSEHSWPGVEQRQLRDALVAYAKGFPENLDVNEKMLKLVYDTGIKRPVGGILKDMGFKGTDAELNDMARRAIEHYGEDKVRDVLAKTSLYNSLHPSLKEKISGSGSGVDAMLVASQLVNGTLGDKNSTNKFLLDDVEGKVRAISSKARDEVYQGEKNIRAMDDLRMKELKALAAQTKKGVTFWNRVGSIFGDDTVDEFEDGQRAKVRTIAAMDKSMAAAAGELAKPQAVVTFANVGQESFQHAKFMMNGQVKEADLLAVRMLSRNSLDDLKKYAPYVFTELTRESTRPIDYNVFQRLQANGMGSIKEMSIYDSVRNDNGQALYTSPEGFSSALNDLRSKYYSGDQTSGNILRNVALNALDNDFAFKELAKESSAFNTHLPVLTQMFESGMEGTKYHAFVNDARRRASEMERAMATMNRHEPELGGKSRVELIQDRIKEMKEVAATTVDQSTKREMERRIQTLEDGIKVFTPDTQANNKMMKMLDLIKGEHFDANTFGNWLKTEGPVILVAIAAAAAVIATCGTATPLAIAAGLLLAPAAAGLASDATKWAMGHDSIIGDYVKGKPVIDKDGNKRERSIGSDVLAPLGKQYLMDLAICVGTMGLGTYVLGPLVRKGGGKLLGAFCRENSATISSAAQKLEQIELIAAKTGQAGYGKRFMQEFWNNVKFTGQQETATALTEASVKSIAGENLQRGNMWLGIAATCMICTIHGAKGAHMRPEPGKNAIRIEAGEMPMKDVMRQFHVDGHTVTPIDGKSFKIRTPEGQEMTVSDTRPGAGKDGIPKMTDIVGKDYKPAMTLDQPVKPLDAPAPTEKPRLLSDESLDQSRKYGKDHRVTENFENGFTNAGPGRSVSRDGRSEAPRASIHIDRVADPVLSKTISEARAHMEQFKSLSPERQAQELAKFVQEKFASKIDGIDPNSPEAARLKDAQYVRFMTENAGKSVPLGKMLEQRVGGCSEMSMLYKTLAHDLNLFPGAEIALVRGNGVNGGNTINHVWVEVKFPGDAKARIYDLRQGVLGDAVGTHPRYKAGQDMPPEPKKGINDTGIAEFQPGQKIGYEGQSDWKVKYETGDGRVVIAHDSVAVVSPAERQAFIDANPHLKTATPDLTQTVKLPNGEEGWKIRGVDKETGSYVLFKEDGVKMTVKRENVFRSIPETSRPQTDATTPTSKLPEWQQHATEIETYLRNSLIPAAEQAGIMKLVNEHLQNPPGADLAKAKANVDALVKMLSLPEISGLFAEPTQAHLRSALKDLALDPKLPERVAAYEQIKALDISRTHGLQLTPELLLNKDVPTSHLETYKNLLSDVHFKAELSQLNAQRLTQFKSNLTEMMKSPEMAERSNALSALLKSRAEGVDVHVGLESVLSKNVSLTFIKDCAASANKLQSMSKTSPEFMAGQTTLNTNMRVLEVAGRLDRMPAELHPQIHEMFKSAEGLIKAQRITTLAKIDPALAEAIKSGKGLDIALAKAEDAVINKQHDALEKRPPLEEKLTPKELEHYDKIYSQILEAVKRPQPDPATTEYKRFVEQKVDDYMAGRGRAKDSLPPDGGPVRKEKIVHIVLGLPGAGKTSAISTKLQNEYGARLIDADFIKPEIPGYDGGIGNQFVHPQSTEIADAVRNKAYAQGDNLVVSGVGRKVESVTALIEQARKNGYQVAVHLAEIPPDMSARRVFDRGYMREIKPGGEAQLIPLDYPYAVGQRARLVFDYVTKMPGLVDAWSHYDTTPSWPNPGILVAKSQRIIKSPGAK